MENLQKILVVSRSTQECQKALNYGITFAQKFDAELYVLQTFYNVFGLRGWNLPIPSQMLEEGFQKMQEETKKEIERMVEKAQNSDLKVHVLLREGKFMNEVSKVVDEAKIDLMVLAAHSEWRLEHFLFGRNNEDVLRNLPCSVVFVKITPHQFRDSMIRSLLAGLNQVRFAGQFTSGNIPLTQSEGSFYHHK